MNNEDKLIKILESLVIGQNSLQAGQDRIEKKLDNVEQEQSHIQTALKSVATKKDVEDLADGQDELKSILHTREAKLVKKVKEHEDRIVELEKQTGITNPHKN